MTINNVECSTDANALPCDGSYEELRGKLNEKEANEKAKRKQGRGQMKYRWHIRKKMSVREKANDLQSDFIFFQIEIHEKLFSSFFH